MSRRTEYPTIGVAGSNSSELKNLRMNS